MRFSWTWLLAAPVVMTGACSACSNAGPADAGRDSAPPDAPSDAVDTGPPCTPAPRPSYVPDGWIPYDDYAPCSGLYVPTSTAVLPAPITWQPCESAAGVSGCGRVQLDWSPLPNPTSTGADAVVDSNGKVVVLESRDFGSGAQIDHRLMLITGADGPVYSAVLATEPARFLVSEYIPPAFTLPRWIFLVIENMQSSGGGYLAGTVANPMPTSHKRFTIGVHSNVVGDLGILDVTSNAFVSLLDFDSGAKMLDIKTPSLPMSFEWMFRDQVYWQGNSGWIDDVGRWTYDAGAIDFINYGFDPTHGAAALGTDGTDMVWFEEFGMNPDGGPYLHSSIEYWTSPYVTSPAQLQPRRLRSETPPATVGNPISVGCGRAAYMGGYGVRILRLSDGWSWFLANANGWYWVQALALTCDELFTQVSISGPITTMARVALNQLGPGVPPD